MADVKWLDGDMHVAEPVDLWAEYIAPSFREDYRRWTPSDPNYSTLRQPAFGAATSAVPGAAALASRQSAIKERRLEDYAPYVSADGKTIEPEGQLRAMDTEGIQVSVLYPTAGTAGVREAPAPMAMALARAYNDWVHAFCRHDPSRLKMSALVPFSDPELAAEEVRRVARDLGAVSVFPMLLHQGVVARLDQPSYESVWTAAEQGNIAIAFHGGVQAHLGGRFTDSEALNHATGRSIEHPVAFLELLFGGVLERHPRLRIAFLEAGCSWVPYWLYRAEAEWERYRDDLPGLKDNVRMRPIEYWQRQCWASAEVDEWPLKATIDVIGEGNLLLASDFPHFDSAFPHARERFDVIPGVSEESRRKILGQNAARLYGLVWL